MEMPEKSLLLGKFRKACLSLDLHKRVCIVHHSDTDGLCSAVIAAKAIEKISGKKPEQVLPFDYGNDGTDKKLLEKIRKIYPDTIFVLDLNIDSKPTLIRKLESECRQLVIIDHHKVYADFNSKKTVFLKAQYFRKIDGSKYPNAKFTFDLFSKIAGLEDLGWIACVGILGDKGDASWENFFRKTISDNGVSMEEIKKTNQLINAVRTIKPGEFGSLFEEFFSAKKPADILESRFAETVRVYEKVLDEWLEKFRKGHFFEKKLELMHFTIKPQYNIKSPLIDAISSSYPNRTIVIFAEFNKGRMAFSARRQDFKIKMNDVLANSIRGIPDSAAGGHIPAAAGSIPKKYSGKFLENLRKELVKNYK